MKKADVTTQQVFSISQFTKISYNTSSKGNLPKYSNGIKWIKTNVFGYESLAEVISSRVGAALGLNIVQYIPCFLDTENEFLNLKPACISESFIPEGYSEVSFGRLLQQVAGLSSAKELYKAFEKQGTPTNKVDWAYSLVENYIEYNYFMQNIAELLWFDKLVYNTDRHLFNIVLLLNNNTGKYKFAPIFDCGASLLSDLQDYPLDMPISIALRHVKAKPFSTNFEKQVSVFKSYLENSQVKDIHIIVDDLTDYYDIQYVQRALDVLNIGLNSMGIILHTDGSGATHFFERCPKSI